MSNRAITILIKAKDLTKGAFNALKSGVSKVGGFLAQNFATILKGGAVIGGAIAGAGAWFVKAAAQAEESNSKFKAVMKELTGAADAWAGSFAESVKRNKTEVKGWMSTLQDTFVPLGFTRTKALDLAKSLTTLTVDLASFNDKAEPDVLADLQSAIVGNHETMRKYGVILTEAGVQQEAVRLGLAKSTKEVTNAAKVQARYSLIMQGTTDAQGDAVKTAGSFTNRMKGLKAAVSDARIAVGAALIESTDMADIVEKLTGAVKRLAEGGYIELWAERVREAFKEIVPLAGKVATGFGYIKSGIAKVGGFIGGAIEGGDEGRWAAALDGAKNVEKFQKERDRLRLEQIRTRKRAQQAAQEAEEAATYEAQRQKDLAKETETVTTGASDKQKAAAQALKELTEERTDTEEDSAATLEEANTKALEAAKERLELAKEEAKTVAEAKQQLDTGRAARSGSGGGGGTALTNVPGAAFTPEDFKKYGAFDLKQTAKAEADRITRIVEAIQVATGGQKQDQYLKVIAEHTEAMRDYLAEATSLG